MSLIEAAGQLQWEGICDQLKNIRDIAKSSQNTLTSEDKVIVQAAHDLIEILFFTLTTYPFMGDDCIVEQALHSKVAKLKGMPLTVQRTEDMEDRIAMIEWMIISSRGSLKCLVERADQIERDNPDLYPFHVDQETAVVRDITVTTFAELFDQFTAALMRVQNDLLTDLKHQVQISESFTNTYNLKFITSRALAFFSYVFFIGIAIPILLMQSAVDFKEGIPVWLPYLVFLAGIVPYIYVVLIVTQKINSLNKPLST